MANRQGWLFLYVLKLPSLVIYDRCCNRPLAFGYVEWYIAVLDALEELYYMMMGFQYPRKSKVAIPFFHF